MGEIAEMMLDGTLCEQCGEFLGLATGYPVVCDACKAEDARSDAPQDDGPNDAQRTYRKGEQVLVPAKLKVVCPECNKRVKAVGFFQHLKDMHS